MKSHDPELRAFLESRNEEVSPSLRKRVSSISEALVGSRVAFIARLLLMYAVGYFLSLSICEQHNIGFFVLSRTLADALARLPPLLCAASCGTLFTGIPFLTARLFLNPFKQRYLMSRLWWVVLPIPVVAIMLILSSSGVMGGEHVHGATASARSGAAWMGLWLAAALATPYLLEALAWFLFLKRRPASA